MTTKNDPKDLTQLFVLVTAALKAAVALIDLLGKVVQACMAVTFEKLRLLVHITI